MGIGEALAENRPMKEQAEAKLGEEVLAVGELRQGKAPSMLAMATGVGLVEVLRPRRSKALPKRFVLAVTPQRVVAFKSIGLGSEDNSEQQVVVRGEETGSWSRAEVALTDLPDGPRSKGGVLRLGAEQLPVAKPNLDGDPETDELFRVLSE